MSPRDQVATETLIMFDQAETSGQMVNSHLLCLDGAFTRIYLYLPHQLYNWNFKYKFYDKQILNLVAGEIEIEIELQPNTESQ